MKNILYFIVPDGSAVVSGSVSDQGMRFVINMGSVTYEIDEETNVSPI
jgi:hypothetical protein